MEESTVSAAVARGNPVCFLDIAVGGVPVGRIKLELFKHLCPKATENFVALCTGALRLRGAPAGYKGSKVHRIIAGFMVQGGDFVKGDGTGRACLWGDRFADEPAGLRARHAHAGLLCMANSGPDTNGCQWYITCAKADWLDGKHVVFGRCLDADSLLVVRKLERLPVAAGSGRPTVDVVVAECGEL